MSKSFWALMALMVSIFISACGNAYCVTGSRYNAAGCVAPPENGGGGGGGGNNPPPMGMTMYLDGDGDGYGAGAPVPASTCMNGVRCSFFNTDCNDGNGAVHPGATETCNTVDDNCNGQVDENLSCMMGPAPMSMPEICSNGRDDNGNGQVDEGCNSPMSTDDIEVRLVYDLPPNVPNFVRIKGWNPYIHTTAPTGCEVSMVSTRHFECSWRQGRLQPFTAQVEIDLAEQITYHDQQSMIANPPQTRIWGCTQGDWSTGFDTFGTTTIYIGGVFAGSAANGVMSGAMIMVDNSRGPRPGSDGPRCHNGCNFSLSNLEVPRNSCTNN